MSAIPNPNSFLQLRDDCCPPEVNNGACVAKIYDKFCLPVRPCDELKFVLPINLYHPNFKVGICKDCEVLDLGPSVGNIELVNVCEPCVGDINAWLSAYFNALSAYFGNAAPFSYPVGISFNDLTTLISGPTLPLGWVVTSVHVANNVPMPYNNVTYPVDYIILFIRPGPNSQCRCDELPYTIYIAKHYVAGSPNPFLDFFAGGFGNYSNSGANDSTPPAYPINQFIIQNWFEVVSPNEIIIPNLDTTIYPCPPPCETVIVTINIPCDLPPGCYQICFYEESENPDDPPVIVFCSQCIEVGAQCFTKMIRYRNNENAFGFIYPAGIYQQVRLPIDVFKGEIKGKKRKFIKSDGVEILLSAVLRKEFVLQTDYMNDAILDALDIALAHDTFEIFNDETNTWERYVTDQQLNRKWQNKNEYQYRKCQGETKISLTPYFNVNRYCK